MFDDVPGTLTNAVKELPDSLRGDLRYVIAAGLVVAQYLRKNYVSDEVPEFIGVHRGDDGGVTYKYTVRVGMIGETIFLLRRCPGFLEICRRLASRDLRSAFYEAIGARLFFRAGFDIEAYPESMVKGQDFDFTAVRDDQRLNVEVTNITPRDFSPATLINALSAKRSQLPSDRPAIIVCAYPETWLPNALDPGSELFPIIKRFFDRTRRINAVVCVTERHVDAEPNSANGALILSQQVFWNSQPRHPVGLEFLTNNPPLILPSNHDEFEKMQESSRSDFHLWVDHLVSR